MSDAEAEVMGMTALSTLVDSLKRELAVPGVFADVFPDTSDTDLRESLADGFSEAQLHGFFTDMTLNAQFETSRELSAAGGALVVIFTAMRIIRAQMRSMTMNERYQAGPVEYSTQRSATLLREELDYLRERVDNLVTVARRSARSVYVLDGYAGRVLANTDYLGGLHGYEYKA